MLEKPKSPPWRLVGFARLPLDDYLAALAAIFPPVTAGRLALILAGCGLSWWIYVPVHELAHAYGCILGGGEVTRLEIDAIYGAGLLQRLFPFVVVGSEYAGRLSGFDTGGSDLTYLLTDFLPFALTILVGVPLLRLVPSLRRGNRARCLLLGVAAPVAYAPFVSLFGDYYEMGSILVTRLVATFAPGFAVERWRSDDLMALVGKLSGSLTPADAAGVTGGALTGLCLALATYAAGAWVADRLTRSS